LKYIKGEAFLNDQIHKNMSARPKTGNIQNTTSKKLFVKYLNLKEEKYLQNSS
jgi:hypothetical protein